MQFYICVKIQQFTSVVFSGYFLLRFPLSLSSMIPNSSFHPHVWCRVTLDLLLASARLNKYDTSEIVKPNKITKASGDCHCHFLLNRAHDTTLLIHSANRLSQSRQVFLLLKSAGKQGNRKVSRKGRKTEEAKVLLFAENQEIWTGDVDLELIFDAIVDIWHTEHESHFLRHISFELISWPQKNNILGLPKNHNWSVRKYFSLQNKK